jgi:hypothetical protein
VGQVDDAKHVLRYTVTVKQAQSELRKHARSVRKTIDRLSQNGKNAKRLKFLQIYYLKLAKIESNISAHPSSYLGRAARASGKEIRDNINDRLAANFKTSRRLGSAIADDRSLAVEYNQSKGLIRTGLAHRDVLDQWTSIHKTRSEGSYTPPATYNSDSWWVWHEFTGAKTKQNFFPGSFAKLVTPVPKGVVTAPYKHFLGGFSPRPFLLFDKALFREDQASVDNIKIAVRDAIKAALNFR